MKVEARKVYRTGRSSYIITLPKNWVEEFGIKEGDTLFLEIKENSICIKPKIEEKSLRANIEDAEAKFNHLVRLVISYYLAGYSSMAVRVYSDEQRRAVAFAVDLLVGAEIMEDTGNKLLIEVFLDVERFEIDAILEKLFNITLSMLKDLKDVVANLDRAVCSTILTRENEVDKLHFLVLRLLNHAGEGGIMHAVDAMNYRSVVRNLERVSDHISQMSEATLNLERGYGELSEMIETLENIFRRAMVCFFKNDRKIAEEVLEDVEDFTNRILKYYEKIAELEVVQLMNLKTILDSVSRVAGYSADIAEVVINKSVY
ncbi:phosphate uptake regulator PhoU [Archaeoglobus fulgidus]|uniref:SpoVT-AbrB domain-containing protein n=1 Tax=Archaeoglobus fulgidus (strain ATCC 49558 / DSM 4304 / JCM 9628 / NBRC 100126 / VC-16) TaxID=224325 RepID=O28916_ARCFU|nr:phosphate uptake regulator PhoU [Archaeoglobus fulgidus]AAB89895.1 predicted coding region AF_1355 [Archaeoglobus fulgidus DSM 4304]